LHDLPFWAPLAALIILLLLSAFFSIAETSMMALNRFRLSHLVSQGKNGAALAAKLLKQTEKLLSTILLGNNLVNTIVTALVTTLAIRQFGNDDSVIVIATTIVALLIIIFCEIIPKVIGATYPERIALPSAIVLRWVMKLASPVVWAINLVSGRILRLLGVSPDGASQTRLSNEELRSIVLESGQFMPGKHRAILLNLFDLEHITVDDVMTPRNRIEALNIATSEQDIRQQLLTCYHNKLPVFEGEINRVIGLLHIRRALSLIQQEQFSPQDMRELTTEPYFIPSGTPVFMQLQFFQETKQRLGLVVDEYGELLGLVTLEDIIEEIIGEFTSSAPGGEGDDAWNAKGEAIVEGSSQLRDLNRQFQTGFPLDGPKTLNGLIIEALQDLPEGGVSLRFGPIVAEVINTQGRVIRSVRLQRLASAPAEVAEDEQETG
jgi:Mg2+/Co2+ transporter CorB